MTSTNENQSNEQFEYPPPSITILSNLANQLLIDEQFYLEVLNLARKFGHSSIYHRKVIINLNHLKDSDRNAPDSDHFEQLNGQYLWVPYSEIHQNPFEEGKGGNEKFKAISLLPKKNCWTKRRKLAYLRANEKLNKGPSISKLKPKSSRLGENIKINIDTDRFEFGKYKENFLNKIENENLDLNVETSVSKSDKSETSHAIKSVCNHDNLDLCRINSTDYELFPIFKNYNEGLPNNKIYVKNLSKSVNLDDLYNLFAKFVIPYNASSLCDIRFFERGKLRRQAFVSYDNSLIAANACRNTNGVMLKGKPLLVVFAHLNTR